MTKAIFLSYTGVVLPRRGNEYREFLETLAKSSNLKDAEKAHEWFESKLREYKCNAYGENYMNEEDLLRSLFQDFRDEIKLSISADKLVILCQNCLMYGPVSDEISNFFSLAKLPIYIVSDCSADYAQIEMKRNRLHTHGVVSCEESCSYRNRKEAFEHVLKATGYDRKEVLYVGCDPNLDMKGAEEAEIPAVLLDRRGIYHDAECRRTRSLASLLVNLGE